MKLERPGILTYFLTHKINRILIKYLLVVLTHLSVTFPCSFEGLLPRVFQKKILDFL